MDMFVLHPSEFAFLYNCSLYEVDDVPLEQRRKLGIGISLTALTLFFQILYLPCLWAMSKRRNFRMACFKMMFYLGVVDSACMWGTGFFTGVFTIEGAIYCSHPTLIHIVGTIGTSLWYAESTASAILALNRCLVMYNAVLADKLFEGWKTYVWLLLPTAYFIYGVWFLTPCLFSSIYVGWFFNPHLGYRDDLDHFYSNSVLTVHNVVIVVILVGIYVVFAVLLYRREGVVDKRRSKKEISSFCQILLICSLNATTSLGYVYMQFVQTSKTFIMMTAYAFVLTQGTPVIIYLFMNQTIKAEVLGFLRIKLATSQIQPLGSSARSLVSIKY